MRPKAELYDSLATMLGAGLPLLDAAATLASSRGRSSLRTMLVELREQLREGMSLDECMEHQPWWFEPAEVAMVRAARASGELPGVLRSLAERHERSGALSAKVAGALARSGGAVLLRIEPGRAVVERDGEPVLVRDLPAALDVALCEPASRVAIPAVRFGTQGLGPDYVILLRSGDASSGTLVCGLTGYAFGPGGEGRR